MMRRSPRAKLRTQRFTTNSFVAARSWNDTTVTVSPLPRGIEIPRQSRINEEDDVADDGIDEEITLCMSDSSVSYLPPRCPFRMGNETNVCDCVNSENTLFAIARHYLPSPLKSWERDPLNQGLCMTFNNMFDVMENIPTRKIIDDTSSRVHRSVVKKINAVLNPVYPKMILSVTSCRVDLKQSIILHESIREGTTGSQSWLLDANMNDRLIQIGAMMYVIANEMIQITKDFNGEDVNSLIIAEKEKWKADKSWRFSDIFNDPTEPFLDEDGGPRKPDENEVYAAIRYVEMVLLPDVYVETQHLMSDRVRIVLLSHEGRQSRRQHALGHAGTMSEDAIELVWQSNVRLHNLAKSATAQTAVKLWAAGSILMMMATGESFEWTGLDCISRTRPTDYFKYNTEENDNTCSLCGNVQNLQVPLGMVIDTEQN